MGEKIKWKEVERPGYFGKRRPEIVKRLDEQYGKDNWAEMWVIDNGIVSREKAIHYYEKSYSLYVKDLHEKTCLINELCEIASDVYDNDLSNVNSGLAYSEQETVAVHLQDIAVRWAIKQLGLKFKGKELVQIRTTSKYEIGVMLSPGNVPFYKPYLIRSPHLKGWWKRNSVEDFYQSNKIIAIRT